eukprot:Anaeramoba_ignava/a349523_12.p3 GENE.a349523_12~~a349523_12.p3  ORF type:complete len:137 (-),score=12.12 a349523_12:3538-3948(-)
MLVPQKVKYRKQQRGRRKGMALKGSTVAFGQYGIKALEPGWITSRQIEACRVVISREIKKNGKSWIRIFPDKPVTTTPAETRMGKGKGTPEYWVAVVKPGRILFEVESNEVNMKRLAEKVSHKLPIKTKLVTRKEY